MRVETTCRGMNRGEPVDPYAIVIFGASGDLATTKLLPALYALHRHGLLPPRFFILGTARREWSDESFRDAVYEQVRESPWHDEEGWRAFAPHLSYLAGDVTAPVEELYAGLRGRLEEEWGERDLPPNAVFHLSMPPRLYGEIVRKLDGTALLKHESGWRRVVLEKPFGRDEGSARDLDRELHEVLDEEQLYRIDHYLGKETVQNILAFRFANSHFEPIWNHHHVDHVQITAAEAEGIGGRAGYYDENGVVRDMVQNHLLSLLSLTAMEPPRSFRPDDLRDATLKVLESVRPPSVPEDVCLGQYGGSEGDMRAYRDEKGVGSDSITPTFAALRLRVKNERWSGCPFYLRTGKRLPAKRTEVRVHFKPAARAPFGEGAEELPEGGSLVFRLAPDEGILHTFLVKQPGPTFCPRPVTMRFRYDEVFGLDELPGAYEWLLHDVIRGDQSLFPRSDWIYRAWSLVSPILRAWEEEPFGPLPNYEAGTWGPDEADALLGRDGREWHTGSEE